MIGPEALMEYRGYDSMVPRAAGNLVGLHPPHFCSDSSQVLLARVCIIVGGG